MRAVSARLRERTGKNLPQISRIPAERERFFLQRKEREENREVKESERKVSFRGLRIRHANAWGRRRPRLRRGT